MRFQVLFTALIGVLFIIQSPYWFAIGRQGVFSLGGWAPQLHAEFHELRATLVHLGPLSPAATGLSPSLVRLSVTIHNQILGTTLVSATPGRSPVWAVPISLAATDGIEVSLFSCRYLDVSVPYVRFRTLCIQIRMTRRNGPGFPIRRSQDRSLVTSSPGLIAGSHVLHRLLTPRHPPHALSSLITPTNNRTPPTRKFSNGLPRGVDNRS